MHPRARPMPIRVLLGALILSASFVPSASADQTVTQVVPTGGTITTGTTVSPDDPVQLTFTASRGGTITIVKRTAPTRSAPATFEHFGPRFEITGDAQISNGTFLIHGGQVPESGWPGRPRIYNIAPDCRMENSQGGTAPQKCIQYEFAGGETNAEGNLEVRWFRPASAAYGAETHDLAQHGTGGGNLMVDLKKRLFTGDWGVDPHSSLDRFLRDGGFKAEFYCVYTCSPTLKMTVSQKVRRALGLASSTIGSGVLKEGKRQSTVWVDTLDLAPGVAKTLKKRRVAALGGDISGFITGPDGERIKQRTYDFYMEGDRQGLSCGVRGISSEELRISQPKGTTTCPGS